MSTLSSSQKVLNDISVCEDASDHRVDPQKYYIVRIYALDTTINLIDFAKKDLHAKYIMGVNIVCAYVYRNIVYLLFSSVEPPADHYLQGSHHQLCSHYASNTTKVMGSPVVCNIIEFDSRTKILVYFQTKVFQNMKATLVRLAGKHINKKDITTLTQLELVNLLEQKTNVKWDSLTPTERYGTFYKFFIDADNTKKFSAISNFIDTERLPQLQTYLFE